MGDVRGRLDRGAARRPPCKTEMGLERVWLVGGGAGGV